MKKILAFMIVFLMPEVLHGAQSEISDLPELTGKVSESDIIIVDQAQGSGFYSLKKFKVGRLTRETSSIKDAVEGKNNNLTWTIDCSLGAIHELVLLGDVKKINFVNCTDNVWTTLETVVEQDIKGNRKLSFDSVEIDGVPVKGNKIFWAGSIAPTVSREPGAIDILTFQIDRQSSNERIFGFVGGQSFGQPFRTLR